MAGYVKLFSSILDSSIMDEPVVTRWIWVSMLAMKDVDGMIIATVGGVARRAGVSREEAETALASFLAPDPESKSKEDDGRRLQPVEGLGWKVLNHKKYKELESVEQTRERTKERVRRFRENEKAKAAQAAEQEQDVTVGNARNGIRSDQGSVSSPLLPVHGSDPEESNPDASAYVWEAKHWQRNFNMAWSAAYNTMALPWGGEASAKATANLGDMLGGLKAEDALAAQARAGLMFAEYLSDSSSAVVKARHPWAWFVTRFQGLLAPAKQTTAPGHDGTIGIAHQVTQKRVAGDVKL